MAGVAAGGLLPETADDGRLVRVGPDHFRFELAGAGRTFVPFGANLVLRSKEDLDNFGPRYSRVRMERVLDAAAALGINLLKVFLPIHAMLPDPQPDGGARPDPLRTENLMAFLPLCRARGIRVVISLTEWGGNGLQWWQQGGQYWGRPPWQTGGPDSIGTLCAFWEQFAARFRGNPTVFSYTPCVEWSMPAGNLTYVPPTADPGVPPGDTALRHWRAWAQARYGSMDGLSRAWSVPLRSAAEITPIDYSYDEAARAYRDTARRILDYQAFREWTTLRYFRPQLAAIKAADPSHMTTLSLHMRSWNLWTGAARHFLGYTPHELAPYVDYLTHHANYDEAEMAQHKRSISSVARDVEVMCRFANAGQPRPVILEEFTYGAADPSTTARAQEAIVRQTIGSASGWTTWYLQYPEGANEADAAHPSCWLDADLKPTAWGLAARTLAAELAHADIRRKPGRRVVTLDREAELLPRRTGTLIDTYTRYDELPQPTDFRAGHERGLDVRLPGDPRRPGRA